MSSRIHRDLKQILHPYLFVLKEGHMNDDLLDYRLVMLHVHCREIMKTPKGSSCEMPVMTRLAEEITTPLADTESDLSKRKVVPRPKA